MNLASHINDIVFFYLPCKNYHANYHSNFIAFTCTKDNGSCLKKRIEDNNNNIYFCFEEENYSHYIELTNMYYHISGIIEYKQEVRVMIFFTNCSILRERRD